MCVILIRLIKVGKVISAETHGGHTTSYISVINIDSFLYNFTSHIVIRSENLSILGLLGSVLSNLFLTCDIALHSKTILNSTAMSNRDSKIFQLMDAFPSSQFNW